MMVGKWHMFVYVNESSLEIWAIELNIWRKKPSSDACGYCGYIFVHVFCERLRPTAHMWGIEIMYLWMYLCTIVWSVVHKWYTCLHFQTRTVIGFVKVFFVSILVGCILGLCSHMVYSSWLCHALSMAGHLLLHRPVSQISHRNFTHPPIWWRFSVKKNIYWYMCIYIYTHIYI